MSVIIEVTAITGVAGRIGLYYFAQLPLRNLQIKGENCEMQIQLDPLTVRRLGESLNGRPGFLKLFYDTEDCGCNGVLVIQIVDSPNATDIVFQNEPYTFLCDRQQESLFDSSMTLAAEENYPSYKLTSPSGLFSSNLRVKDLRLAVEG